MIYRHKLLSAHCITVLGLVVLASGCTAGHEPAPIDIQCNQALKQARAQYQRLGTQLEGTGEGDIIANLINAARIEQQQARFIPCLDRSQRALKLLQGIAPPQRADQPPEQ